MPDLAPTNYFRPGDPRLPEPLHHLQPPLRSLTCAGRIELLGRRPRIGVIGARAPRADAVTIARRLTREAARAGFVIVSGLAVGIDGMAHEAALEVGGSTIAVLPCGLAQLYPTRNRPLAARIAGSRARGLGARAGEDPDAPGLLVTEYGGGTEPAHRHRFVERNRIIAALSDYLVVVQARERSGSMGTAQAALDLGVPIGVVPSAPDDPTYAGSIMLIHDGADAVVDGPSLFRRLELHGIMQSGFAEAAGRGARVDPDRPGLWIGGASDHDAPQLTLDDHPIASLLQVPRAAEELAELAGMTLRDARVQLLDLEGEGRVVHTDDGTWLAVDAL